MSRAPAGSRYTAQLRVGSRRNSKKRGSDPRTRSAAAAARHLPASGADTAYYESKIVTARFYAEQVMPLADAHRRAIESGPGTLYALGDDDF